MEELKIITDLTSSLKVIPGIGSKSASRIAYEFLTMDKAKINNLINSLNAVKDNIKICPICGCYLDEDKCPVCSDNSRDKTSLMVVSSYKDVLAFEKLHFKGKYHILNGNISPSKGIGPDDLKLDKLIDRIRNDNILEVILATSSTLEGETTAMYISRLLSSDSVKITRLASGLPMGAMLDYTDELTLTRALENRVDYKNK